MPKKILDIDLIEEKSSDYTFFEIDEDENNKTLKALKQSYVTSNYKDETILNLQQELKEHTNVLPKEIKLESYNKYNNALELAQKSYITTAIRLVDEVPSRRTRTPSLPLVRVFSRIRLLISPCVVHSLSLISPPLLLMAVF